MLFVGDDWAEDHHDVEVMDPAGRRLAKARLPEGVTGISTLHEMIGEHNSRNSTMILHWKIQHPSQLSILK